MCDFGVGPSLSDILDTSCPMRNDNIFRQMSNLTIKEQIKKIIPQFQQMIEQDARTFVDTEDFRPDELTCYEIPVHSETAITLTPDNISHFALMDPTTTLERYILGRPEITYSGDSISHYIYKCEYGEYVLLHHTENGVKLSFNIYDMDSLEQFRVDNTNNYIIYKLELRNGEIDLSMFETSHFLTIERLCDLLYRYVNMIDFNTIHNVDFIMRMLFCFLNYQYHIIPSIEEFYDYISNYNLTKKHGQHGHSLTIVFLSYFYNVSSACEKNILNLVLLDFKDTYLYELYQIHETTSTTWKEYLNYILSIKCSAAFDYHANMLVANQYIPSQNLEPLFTIETDINDYCHDLYVQNTFLHIPQEKINKLQQQMTNLKHVFFTSLSFINTMKCIKS
jgi:hypothetical protein